MTARSTVEGIRAERSVGRRPEQLPRLEDWIGEVWTRFWFTPADPRPLALIRIATGCLALALWWSYAADLEAWFGNDGMLPSRTLGAWRSPWGGSIFDLATTPTMLRGIYLIGGLVLLALLAGLCTPVVSLLAPIFFASILQRGPMLAGPADDVVAVILWCLAIGRCGDAVSLDRLFFARQAGPHLGSFRNRIAVSLLRVHASLLTIAALLAQLKGDVWWDGTAAWWLAARGADRTIDLTGPLAASLYATNLLTHAITLFEVAFALGVWCVPLRPLIVPIAVVCWPLLGLFAGEPFWGLAMAILALAFRDAAVRSGGGILG
jgi:hypothetical protein